MRWNTTMLCIAICASPALAVIDGPDPVAMSIKIRQPDQLTRLHDVSVIAKTREQAVQAIAAGVRSVSWREPGTLGTCDSIAECRAAVDRICDDVWGSRARQGAAVAVSEAAGGANGSCTTSCSNGVEVTIECVHAELR